MKKGGGPFKMFTQIEISENVIDLAHFYSLLNPFKAHWLIVPCNGWHASMDFRPLIDWKSQKHTWVILRNLKHKILFIRHLPWRFNVDFDNGFMDVLGIL